jgi:RNA polymerase sigma factor (sigma-70 family)
MDSNYQAFKDPEGSGKLVSLSDYQLWKEFRAGDLAAYSLIYRKYFFILFNYGKKISPNHELVKDCIQDLFVKIWNNRENLSDTTSIRYYLLTSLKRKLFDTLESTNNRFLSGPDLTELEMMEAAQEENEYVSNQKEKVFKALKKLSKHQQRILQKKFFEDQSNQDIAADLNITVQSVYNLVFKSLRSLRKQLRVILILLLPSFFC